MAAVVVVVAAAAGAVVVEVNKPASKLTPIHRVGIGWRPEIASFILNHADLIDDIEIVIENFISLNSHQREQIEFLASLYTIHFHGVGLGVACSEGIPSILLKKLNSFFSRFPNPKWSDHFSFVRSGNIELGHLGAPPRNDHTIEIILKNLKILEKELGRKPILENVSTLLYPPMSTLTEAQWINRIVTASNSGILLDINNVYCNAVNFGDDPFSALADYSFERVRQIHMSGGKWIRYDEMSRRMLDDHKHDIPEIGFQMLTFALSKIDHPISIILERDGNYPDSSILRDQLLRIHALIKRPIPKDHLNELFYI